VRLSRHPTFGRLATIAGLLLGLPSAGLARQTEPAWAYHAAGEVSRFAVTAIGDLLVADSSGVRALEPVTGQVRWHRPDAFAFHTLGAVDLVILETPAHWEVTEMATGTARWTGRDLPLARSWHWAKHARPRPAPRHGHGA
jgi:hypothetical protein